MKHKHIILFALLLFTASISAQIQFTAGVNYESGVPSGAPSSTGSRIRADLSTGRLYLWSPSVSTWRLMGQGIDVTSGCVPPAYTPAYGQSTFAVNGCNELYVYASSVWSKVSGGGGGTYYAGEGIDIDNNDTISIDTVKRLSFRTDATYTGGIGTLSWNATDGTLDLGLLGGNTSLQVGQEQVILVKHADNSGLTNGKVVYIVGSSGDNKTVRYAQANAEATSANTFGLMTESATGGNKAFCTTFGLVRNINTSNLTEGGVVWLSKDTAGAMTAVRPEAPNHGVMIGFCVRKHATTGSIYVQVQNGYELDELHNVNISGLLNGQALLYDSIQGRWENTTLPDRSSINELQTIDTFSLSGQTLRASLSSDGQAAKTVTLPVVGITAGTNVTVSESAGNYTINATGGSSLSGVTNYLAQFNSSSTIDTTGIIWLGNLMGVGVASPSARLHVMGQGNTSGTNALLVDNSDGTSLLSVGNTGIVNIGSSSSLSSIGSSQIKSSSAATNSNIVLSPKGSGCVIAGPPPDGSAAVGGNARGIYSIDMQLIRTAANQVASGTYATVAGGWKQRASGDRSTVCGGEQHSATGLYSSVFGGDTNTASGTYSTVIGGSTNTSSSILSYSFGQHAVSNLYGAQTYSSARLGSSASGTAQTMTWRYMREITGTGISELTLDAAAPSTQGRATLTANRLWNVNLQVSAICSTVGNGTLTLGDSFVGVYQVGIKRLVNTTTLVGTVQNVITAQSDANMSSSVVTITADDTNESLKVEFTPPSTAGSTSVFRVVVTATATVVGY